MNMQLTQSISMMLGDDQTVTRQHSTMKCVEVNTGARRWLHVERVSLLTSASQRHRQSDCTETRCAIHRIWFDPAQHHRQTKTPEAYRVLCLRTHPRYALCDTGPQRAHRCKKNDNKYNHKRLFFVKYKPWSKIQCMMCQIQYHIPGQTKWPSSPLPTNAWSERHFDVLRE